MSAAEPITCDVLLVGGGIMSATLGVLLKHLGPDLSIEVCERLPRVAMESSDAKNNAGTGHSALCELNYTPIKEGVVDIQKALQVMHAFETSKHFWGQLCARGVIEDPKAFVHSVPHMSFVRGAEESAFLSQRFSVLRQHPLFAGMELSREPAQLSAWAPLLMQERPPGEDVAATFAASGTDVDFGALTRAMFAHLERDFGIAPWLEHEVTELDRLDNGLWRVDVTDQKLGIEREFQAKFVFLGAGGGTLELLQRSEIAEAKGYGGFPISGQWLVCRNDAVIAQHHAKIYGKAAVGTPPMSVPHLDSRYIGGSKQLLFGPFAGFSTKFLKQGSYVDMPAAFSIDNVLPMLSAGLRNVPLTQYLIAELAKSMDDHIDALRAFMPSAHASDWELTTAGQRVQVIKPDAEGWGTLEFGTEIISARDNSLAALLGASPGASTSVSIAIALLQDCFPEQLATTAWQQRLRAWIPGYGENLANNVERALWLRAQAHTQLGLGT